MNILSSYLRKLDGCFFLKYGFKSGCPETRYGIQDSYFESQIEAVVWRLSIEKVFLEILQHSQENTCARVSFLIKFFLKKRLWHRCFPVNVAKFLRTPFLQNISRRLLLRKVNKYWASFDLLFLFKM